MARTRATVAAKVSSGKSSKARSNAAPPPHPGPSGERERTSKSHSGGNPVCPRETPVWQRPITNFFISNKPHNSDSDEEAGSSKSQRRRNVIESDGEEGEAPQQTELDESVQLQPLTGEDSHKIDEYYAKKNKGKGKKTAGNGDRGKHKRGLDTSSDEDCGHRSKKTKADSSASD